MIQLCFDVADSKLSPTLIRRLLVVYFEICSLGVVTESFLNTVTIGLPK